MIDWFYTNVVVEEMDTRSVEEIVEAVVIIVKIILVHKADVVAWVHRDDISKEIFLS